MYIALNSLQIDSCLVGKSNMFKRSELEQALIKKFGKNALPGLACFANVLGEDNMMYVVSLTQVVIPFGTSWVFDMLSLPFL